MNKKEFVEHLKKLKIDVSNDQLLKLDKYYKMLKDWNNNINLTRIIEENEVYLKHFYDSLTIVKVIDLNQINELCDVGTGAGFPGLILKIFFPELNITLIESQTKKTKFLNEVIKVLKLKKVNVVNDRVENYAKKNKGFFDIIIVRALSQLPIIIELCIPLLKINGCLIAMKGKINGEIINSVNALKMLNSKIVKVEKFKLPINNNERSLIVIKKNKTTNSKYPRFFTKIKKNPL